MIYHASENQVPILIKLLVMNTQWVAKTQDIALLARLIVKPASNFVLYIRKPII